MSLFQTKVRFLGHNSEKGKIIPINRSIEFASKFADIITDKTQLQRFLGSLNYISPFYKDLAKNTAILYDRLKNPKPWTDDHTQAIRRIKGKVHNLPCLTLANPTWQKIIETDASDIGYGGILKQYSLDDKQEYLVQFYSGKWNNSQITMLLLQNLCFLKTVSMMFLKKCLQDGRMRPSFNPSSNRGRGRGTA
ncbi:uncharacterized protein LOC132622066 [Lycium barbarum]|uniref:uncharacterized protein LOC132622066 n=1 Tax=Lycium barbarum TaxID=112863 RepID=UPI00293EBD3F|nr:uncharacterized protein LOC132622066 [Lycium barbarum]